MKQSHLVKGRPSMRHSVMPAIWMARCRGQLGIYRDDGDALDQLSREIQGCAPDTGDAGRLASQFGRDLVNLILGLEDCASHLCQLLAVASAPGASQALQASPARSVNRSATACSHEPSATTSAQKSAATWTRSRSWVRRRGRRTG